MILKDLLKYKNVKIQCHDIPDADTIASAFAVQRYFAHFGIEANIIYGGNAQISKPSLLLMLDACKIDISYVSGNELDADLLITVDCQRGAGNVKNFTIPADAETAVIDHHVPEIGENENTAICSYLSSCSTLVYDLLRKENFEPDEIARTALYYGLFTDTNGFSELRHPLDRDLAEISVDMGMIKKLKYSNITIDELDVIGGAFQKREIVGNTGIFKMKTCDANLLGFAGDIAQQVVNLDCCIVYCEQKHGLKLSFRSSVRESMANEIAEFICRETGNGGGNIEKAGGFMSFSKIAAVLQQKQDENNPGAPRISQEQPEFPSMCDEYLLSRIHAYRDNYDMIYAGNNGIRFDEMSLYRKLPVPVGFVKSADIFPDGTKITIRTLEGDIDTSARENIYFMIGIRGEVYPILGEKFKSSYHTTDEPYKPGANTEYIPIVLSRITNERREIMPLAKTCVPKETKIVRGKKIEKDTKVFSYWDTERYFFGISGDYLVAAEGNYADCYIVRGDIFGDSYEVLENGRSLYSGV